jgi:hypothetical protein
VSTDNAHGWYKAMRMLIEDKDLRKALRDSSRKMAGAWTWQGDKRRPWEDFIRELVYSPGQRT